MADIELVIKIPEEVKQTFDNAKNEDLYANYYDRNSLIGKAIQNGIALPKRHGRLIDADAFIKQESCCGYIEDMEIDYFKQNTPTIIEADKAESEEEDENNTSTR